MAKKLIKPMYATWRQLLSMRRDNITSGDYWCLFDDKSVTITAQKLGEKQSASVTIPKKEFRKMLKFLSTPQAINV